MSSTAPLLTNAINVALKGLMVMFTNKSSECMIELLRNAPSHNLSIEYLERQPGGQFVSVKAFTGREAEGEFDLKVQGTTKTGIQKRKPEEVVDRFEGKSDSFNWMIDFEKDFFAPPIGARKAGFVTSLKVDNGEIFTQLLSQNHLQYKRPGSRDWIHFGRVAVEMGIQIDLDKAESKGVFSKIGGESFQLLPGKDYLIRVERTDISPGNGHDAEAYFTAVGQLLGPGQPIFFRSFPPLVKSGSRPPSTPDATCPITQLGHTDPP